MSMFLCGLLAGSSVSILTVVVLKIFNKSNFTPDKEYKIEIKSGHNYHSGIIKFREIK